MSSHSLQIPFRHARGRLQLGISARIPSLRTAVFIIVAVLILFRWLDFVLALQITGTGRQIQGTTAELHRQERHNAELRMAIAKAESPLAVADVASRLSYQPRPPVYIRTDEPLAGRNGANALETSLANSLAADPAAQDLAIDDQSISLAGDW